MERKKYKPEAPRARRKIPKVVFHPRFGDEVISTGCKVAASEVLASHKYASATEVFVESAIRANVKRQNCDWTEPRHFYADVLRHCVKCRRKFIFFAGEQQLWYEELKINVATTAKYCCECAEESRATESALQRYQQMWGREDLDDLSVLQLAEDLVTLRRAEILKDDQRLRRLKNLLQKRKIDPERWSSLRDFLAG